MIGKAKNARGILMAVARRVVRHVQFAQRRFRRILSVWVGLADEVEWRAKLEVNARFGVHVV